MPSHPTKTRRILEDVGHELKVNEPEIVGETRRKEGAEQAEKQRVAILLSKAKKRGARIPRRGHGLPKRRAA